jgi:nucleoside-diphosphate-sugar epimerase
MPTIFVARTFYERLVHSAPQLLDNPYVATKNAGTELVKLWAVEYQAPVVLGTFFQVYGTGDDNESVLSYAAQQMRAGKSASFGSGRGLRDWIYVHDAADATLAALEKPDGRFCEVDIGSGSLVSIRAVIETMASIAGVETSLLSFDPTKDRSDTDLTLGAEKSPNGWRPQVSLMNGLRKLYFNQ